MFLGPPCVRIYPSRVIPGGFRNLSWEKKTEAETILFRGGDAAVLSLQVAVSPLELYCSFLIVCDNYFILFSPSDASLAPPPLLFGEKQEKELSRQGDVGGVREACRRSCWFQSSSTSSPSDSSPPPLPPPRLS